MGEYDIQQVCLNGHQITDKYKRSPKFRKKFCNKCGSTTIHQCPECDHLIKGYYHVEVAVIGRAHASVPLYCENCGSPYPWTESKIYGALELIKEGGKLSKEELQQFKKDLVELTKDSPKVEVASVRFKKVMTKVGGSIASGVQKIMLDVLSEVVKKNLWS